MARKKTAGLVEMSRQLRCRICEGCREVDFDLILAFVFDTKRRALVPVPVPFVIPVGANNGIAARN